MTVWWPKWEGEEGHFNKVFGKQSSQDLLGVVMKGGKSQRKLRFLVQLKGSSDVGKLVRGAALGREFSSLDLDLIMWSLVCDSTSEWPSGLEGEP